MFEKKLNENVAEHIESDERICASGKVTNQLKTRNFALVATDRNLYAFRLKWPGQSRIAERTLVVPLEQVRFEGTVRDLNLVNRQSGAEMERWRKLPVGDLAPLREYVDGYQST